MVLVLSFCAAGLAWAQQRGREPRFGYRGFVEAAPQTFVASDTFDAIFGNASGLFVGGGGQARWKNLLVEVAASSFKQTGERVFVSNREVFHLGIPTTIKLRPIELTAAYRLPRLWRFRPYAGGGFGSQRYEERSAFNDPLENVKHSDRSYHVVGGAEIRVWRWIATAAEVRYRSVANAIGQGGVSKDYAEDNLGGTSIRARIIVVGR
jgi:opacity protein-like surface antigen